jgi:protein SCO1/2
VPPFGLTDQAGVALTQDSLRGKVWIANFIFTRCPDVCPALTARMHDVAQSMEASQVTVEIVSISVDPTHDTPEVLRAYATLHRAPPTWRFATGPRDDVARLLRDGFHVAFADDGPISGPITHSDRFVLVDALLRIRGYYHGADADDLARLTADARSLATQTER